LEATEEQAVKIKQALSNYELVTRQLINHAKCFMTSGSACLQGDQERVKSNLMVDNISLEEKYLGLLTPAGLMNNEHFIFFTS
jgi:hypothetical protein